MRFRKIAIAGLLGAMFVGSALAADNLTVTQGAGTTIRAKDTGNGLAYGVVIVDSNGNVLGTLPVNVNNGVSQSGTWNVGILGTAQVNVNNGVSQSGTWNVGQSGTWTVQQGTAPWTMNVCQPGATTPCVNVATGQALGNAINVAGGITPATATSSNPLSSPILAAVVTPNSTNYIQGQLNVPTMTSGGVLYTNEAASPQGGATPFHFSTITANSTNATLIKTGPHTLYSLAAQQFTSAGVLYVRLYDTATAPTCSSSTGAIGTLAVATATTSGGQYNWPIPTVGLQINNGLGFCTTAGNGSDTDNTVVPATQMFIQGLYF